jgi:hypothetical protein
MAFAAEISSLNVWNKELRSVFWLTVYALFSQKYFILNFPRSRMFLQSSQESTWSSVRYLFIHKSLRFFWYSIYKLRFTD